MWSRRLVFLSRVGEDIGGIIIIENFENILLNRSSSTTSRINLGFISIKV